MNFSTPILFIIFDRLDTSSKVLEQIKIKKPRVLYIFSDAPRIEKKGEAEKCEYVKKCILESIDWDCEIKTFFPKVNLGPGKGVASAVKWFFENETEGIVLEHDCLPHIDFFDFCEEMLDKYRDNELISMISGSNFTDDIHENKKSYGFSGLGHIWGWASWKRTVNQYDFDDLLNTSEFNLLLKNYPYIKHKGLIRYFKFMHFLLVKKKIVTWDLQLQYVIWKNKGLSIFPHTNLISNIGFGKDAVHCKDENNKLANIKTGSILPLNHPTEISHNKLYDKTYYDRFIRKSPVRSIASKLRYVFLK